MTEVTRRKFGALGAAALASASSRKALGNGVRLQRWQVGDATITCLVDFISDPSPPIATFPFATVDMIEATPWVRPKFVSDWGLVRFAYQGFLIETPSGKILVDTGLGPPNPKTPAGFGRLMQSMAAAHCEPGAIDIVVHTHLHPDHVGWDAKLVSGLSRPTFSKARYVVAQQEYQYWSEKQPDLRAREGFAAAVAPFRAAGQIDLVGMDKSLTPEVRLMASPGHTAGHVCIEIASRGKKAVITGDVLHHPLQFARLDWKNPGDFDADLAVKTRQNLIANWAHQKTLVIGSHFAGITAGRVERVGDAFQFAV